MPVTYVVARMHMEGSCNDSINRGGCDCLMLLKDAVEAFIVLCFFLKFGIGYIWHFLEGC